MTRAFRFTLATSGQEYNLWSLIQADPQYILYYIPTLVRQLSFTAGAALSVRCKGVEVQNLAANIPLVIGGGGVNNIDIQQFSVIPSAPAQITEVFFDAL